MKFLLLALVGFTALPSLAQLSDTKVIQLSESDSSSFINIFPGLSNPETVTDTNNPYIWHVIRSYKSSNEAFQMTCSTEFFSGESGFTVCTINFTPSKSSPDLEVFEGKLGGALMAKFNNEGLASQINRNIRSMPLVASENVSIMLDNGSIQLVPRIRIDCDKIPNSGGMAKSCTLVAMPN